MTVQQTRTAPPASIVLDRAERSVLAEWLRVQRLSDCESMCGRSVPEIGAMAHKLNMLADLLACLETDRRHCVITHEPALSILAHEVASHAHYVQHEGGTDRSPLEDGAWISLEETFAVDRASIEDDPDLTYCWWVNTSCEDAPTSEDADPDADREESADREACLVALEDGVVAAMRVPGISANLQTDLRVAADDLALCAGPRPARPPRVEEASGLSARDWSDGWWSEVADLCSSYPVNKMSPSAAAVLTAVQRAASANLEGGRQ